MKHLPSTKSRSNRANFGAWGRLQRDWHRCPRQPSPSCPSGRCSWHPQARTQFGLGGAPCRTCAHSRGAPPNRAFTALRRGLRVPRTDRRKNKSRPPLIRGGRRNNRFSFGCRGDYLVRAPIRFATVGSIGAVQAAIMASPCGPARAVMLEMPTYLMNSTWPSM